MADDADAVGRFGVHRQRIEDGDATAEQRTSLGEVQRLGQRERPCPMRADVRGKPAAMADDRRLRLRAKVMISRHALATVHVAPENQPTPTRWPTFRALVVGPTAVMRPMTSWPRTAGNCEIPTRC